MTLPFPLVEDPSPEAREKGRLLFAGPVDFVITENATDPKVPVAAKLVPFGS